MSFYADKKRDHESNAEKLLADKDYVKAFFHTAKAAEYGLMLAEQSNGKIAFAHIEDAFDLIEIAEKLKAKSGNTSALKQHTLKQKIQISDIDEQKESWKLLEKPTIKLEDVAGLDQVKRILREDVIMPFEHPEVYERFN